jgi:hypothetical protein
MKERPILFQTPMVKAVLNDLKDITRRATGLDAVNALVREVKLSSTFVDIKGRLVANFWDGDNLIHCPCPYGKPGDVLWCRETWAKIDESIVHKADGFVERYDAWERDTREGIERIERWEPSIFMPREACRLKLEILSIRPERLHDITEEDAIREGIEVDEWTWGPTAFPDGTIDKSMVGKKTKWYRDYRDHKDRLKHWFNDGARKSFETLWISINGQESWNSNPWVWRIEFKRV